MRSITFQQISLLGLLTCALQAQEATITVHTDQAQHRLTRMLTGACIEDVNHEVYGGIDSQMIFGESFAEPAPPPPLKDLKAYGGRWTPATDGSLRAARGDGPKLIWEGPTMGDSEVSVDVRFNGKTGGNAGLIVKASEARVGADQFTGYEVSLEPSGMLVLGRHRQNWEPIRRVPCEAPIDQWVTLRAQTKGKSIEIFVNGKSLIQFEDTEHPLANGSVGLRTWQTEADFRNFSIASTEGRQTIAFALADNGWGDGVSGMWRATRRGTATGSFCMEEKNPFAGSQSQQINFASGTGEIGIENESLNRWGMYFVKNKEYDGYLWARTTNPTEVFVSLESRDGATIHAEKRLKLPAGDWQRLDFTLKPNQTDKTGRFAIKLKQPGTIAVGYVFLQPGSWGRYKGLPVRKDVAQGLVDQGVTVLRYGGSMVNADQYRWKKMIGPRALRPPYAGMWYPHASNGWGVFDFLNFCEAARFEAIPNLNVNEAAQDMADFIEYVNGSEATQWGHNRALDGHPKPYDLKYLEIGNEEQVNDDYWKKFKAISEAIWAKDSNVILVVGDFAYDHVIKDPFNFTGAAGRITSLAAQQKILQWAKQHNREVWFDVHVWTEGPRPNFGGTLTYIDALDKLAEGARHRVVIFEFNAGNHSQKRALGNAIAINVVERDGRLPIATSANCLQPDGQNDNDWNQGLLFLNPSQVWLQPPGYVTQMYSQNYQPMLIKSEVQSAGNALDVSAVGSENGRTLVLQVVNVADQATTAALNIPGFKPAHAAAKVQTLAGQLEAQNTADNPALVKTEKSDWQHGLQNGRTTYAFPANSVTVIKFD